MIEIVLTFTMSRSGPCHRLEVVLPVAGARQAGSDVRA